MKLKWRQLAPYLLAYTIFRLSWSKMAALAMQGEYDEAQLTRDYRKYRALALGLRRRPLELQASGKSANVNLSLGGARSS